MIDSPLFYTVKYYYNHCHDKDNSIYFKPQALRWYAIFLPNIEDFRAPGIAWTGEKDFDNQSIN